MGAVWELVVGHQLCVLLPLVAMLRQRAAKLLRVFYTLMDDGSINFLEDSDITIQLEVRQLRRQEVRKLRHLFSAKPYS